MQISKLLPTFCVAALCASQPTLHAADNPAQAAARQALAQKIFEMGEQQAKGSQPAAPQPPKVSAVPKPAPPVVVAKPEPKVAAPVAKPMAVASAPVNSSGDNAAQAAAREALSKKLFELGSQPAAAKPVAPVKPIVVAKPEPKPVKPVVVAKPEPKPVVKPEPPKVVPPAVVVAPVPKPAVVPAVPGNSSGDNPAQAAAREALSKKLFELGSQPAAPSPVAVAKPVCTMPAPVVKAEPKPAKQVETVVAKPSQTATVPTPAVKSAPQPVAPAAPVMLTKTQKLEALLFQYKADQISPETYHTQRAAILAEP